MFFYHQRRFTERKTIKSFREGRAWYRIQSSLNSYEVASLLQQTTRLLSCAIFLWLFQDHRTAAQVQYTSSSSKQTAYIARQQPLWPKSLYLSRMVSSPQSDGYFYPIQDLYLSFHAKNNSKTFQFSPNLIQI